MGSIVSSSGGTNTTWATTGSTGQTTVRAEQNGNAGTQTIRTVTTGKTFYLMSISLSTTAADVVTIRDNADSAIIDLKLSTGPISVLHANNLPLAIYTSGQNVRWTAAATTWIQIYGVEQ